MTSHSVTSELRKHFPTVYLTLISILVALAVEGLLERIDQIGTLFTISANASLIWIQVGIVLSVAAMFWWVIVRWVSTLPWDFGFFDALMPLLLLVVFHFLAASVGASPARWFVSLGVISVGGAVNYFVSARRALSLVPQVGSSRSYLTPTLLGAGAGAAFLAVGALAARSTPGLPVQIAVNAVAATLVAAFAITEYRAWTRITTELGSSRAA